MADELTVTAEMITALTQFHEADEIRTDYSGRSMYGRTCLGYTGEDVIMFAFRLAVELSREEQDEDEDTDISVVEDALGMMGDPRTDSLGRSTIHYWPNITFAV